MPTYEYKCNACEHEWEVFHSIKQKPIQICPKCKANNVKRLISIGGGIIFKGTGFYSTDYKKRKKNETNN